MLNKNVGVKITQIGVRMNKNLSCTVAKDLLPNYIEHLTSEDTNILMEEHFKECEDCSKVRNEMLYEIKTEKVPEVKNLKKFMNKTKAMYLLKGIIWGIAIISVLVTFIVDIAINRSLTWSLIVDASIVFALMTTLTLIYSKPNKIIKTLAMISVLLFPMLWVFEYVINANYLPEPIYWIEEYALAFGCIWLGILWFITLLNKFTKINMWNLLGIFLLLTAWGSLLTNAIANKTTMIVFLQNSWEWINTISMIACAVICFIIGFYRRASLRNKEIGEG